MPVASSEYRSDKHLLTTATEETLDSCMKYWTANRHRRTHFVLCILLTTTTLVIDFVDTLESQ